MPDPARILVVNGPNLNLLGARQPDVYGSTTLEELDGLCHEWAGSLGMEVDTFQSNAEGALIDRLHAARHDAAGVVLNAGAYTHTSYALGDAIRAVGLPTVEVHISNVKEREPWRGVSVIEPACVHTIYGRGIEGYRDALRHLAARSAGPFTTLSYGSEHAQVGDLRIPNVGGAHPVAVLLHGGFWRHQWTRDLMDGLAVHLTGRGIATWNPEYRRVGAGGGWPETFLDVAQSVDFLAEIAPDHDLALDRVAVVGHSAGGHLALWSAGRRTLANTDLGGDPAVRPRLAVGLAAVSDLAAAQRAGLGDDAVDPLLSGSPYHASLYRTVSPIEMLPLGVEQIIVHGEADDVVPVSMSVSYAQAATQAGDRVRYIEDADADHSDLIDPASRVWTKVAEAITEHL